jgi:pimeloyl-ACP methyl ester carboxylesterase
LQRSPVKQQLEPFFEVTRMLLRVAVFFVLCSIGSAQVRLEAGRERIPGTSTFVGTISGQAAFPLKIYVTRPSGVQGKLPVIFQVGWLSCDTVEIPAAGPDDGFKHLFFDLASRSGYATVRLEKPGVSGAPGPKCSELDFNTELAAYKGALSSLGSIEFVDPSNVTVLGFSNGGGVAPLLLAGASKNVRVQTFVVMSGWYKTWLEHMLELERRRMKLSGVSETEINARMKKYSTFYDQYLNGKKTPGQVIAASPSLKEIWSDQPEHQYGRPASFYHQLQELNLADAWQKVDVPVLAVHPQFDWIMSLDDYKLMAEALNSRKPGSVEFIDWPRIDHILMAHDTPQLAFGDDPAARYDPALSAHVLNWLKKQSP